MAHTHNLASSSIVFNINVVLSSVVITDAPSNISENITCHRDHTVSVLLPPIPHCASLRLTAYTSILAPPDLHMANKYMSEFMSGLLTTDTFAKAEQDNLI